MLVVVDAEKSPWRAESAVRAAVRRIAARSERLQRERESEEPDRTSDLDLDA